MSRRLIVSLLGTVIVLVLGSSVGAAYAYWTSHGLGAGQVSTGTSKTVTIAANATAGTLLQPGGTGDLVITATNNNSADVYITNITLGSVSAAGCTTPSITLTSPSTTYLPVTIPVHANALRITIAGALTMGTDATSDCQGKTFAIPLTVVVHQ